MQSVERIICGLTEVLMWRVPCEFGVSVCVCARTCVVFPLNLSLNCFTWNTTSLNHNDKNDPLSKIFICVCVCCIHHHPPPPPPHGSRVQERGTCGAAGWLRILLLTHYICSVAVVQWAKGEGREGGRVKKRKKECFSPSKQRQSLWSQAEA